MCLRVINSRPGDRVSGLGGRESSRERQRHAVTAGNESPGCPDLLLLSDQNKHLQILPVGNVASEALIFLTHAGAETLRNPTRGNLVRFPQDFLDFPEAWRQVFQTKCGSKSFLE